ncbi:MAG TPA: hypothetical protein VI358_17985 [Pseudolabrys sp.]
MAISDYLSGLFGGGDNANLSPEEQYYNSLSPVDALKLRTELQNKKQYTPEQAQANLQQLGMDALYASPVGNVLSLRDAMEGKWRGQQLEAQGDTEGARREYANAAASAGMGFLPGMGRIGMGRTANTIAREADTTLPAIMAYHGSPHDFERFDMSKIGTGEGAQVYGHGLYFSQVPEVARSYADTLGDYTNALKLKEGFTPSLDEAKLLNMLRGSDRNGRRMTFDSLRNELHNAANQAESYGMDSIATERRAQLALVDNLEKNATLEPVGNVYNVSLDVEPHQLLDWDKPLSEQSLAVQEFAKRIGRTEDGATGSDLITKMHGTVGIQETPKMLREAGIPGIRYLDQGSRGAEGGTHNFVMFDDSLIKMLGKE